MYAIIETGGKQYRVEQGDLIEIELDSQQTDGDSASSKKGSEGAQIEFERVLMVGGGKEGVKVGSPWLDGASVSAAVVGETRGPKILVFKKKRRKGYKRLRGHRQDLRKVRISEINV